MENRLVSNEAKHFRVALVSSEHLVADLVKNALPVDFVKSEAVNIYSGLSALVQDYSIPGADAYQHMLFVIYVVESVDSLSEEQISALQKIRSIGDGCAIVALVQQITSNSFEMFNSIGFDGLIPINYDVKQLRCIVELVKQGSSFYPLEISPHNSNQQTANIGLVPTANSRLNELAVGAPRLTRRQKEVIQLIVKGMPNKEIARKLKLSHSTVKVHVADIMRKLDAANRTHAVAKYASFLRPD